MSRLKEPQYTIRAMLRALSLGSEGQLAEWLGVSRQAVFNAKKRGRIPDDWAIRVADETGMSLDELYFGEMSDETQGDFLFVPLVNASLSAGGGSFETGGDVIREFAFSKEWLMTKGNPSDMILMRVIGDSMEPVISAGDMVLVNQALRSVTPYQVYAVRVEEAIYIKELELLPGKRLVLHSYNRRYSPIELDMNGDFADSVSILGKIIWRCHES